MAIEARERVSERVSVRNAGDEQQVQRARRREELSDRVAASDLRDLLKIPGFQRFMMRLLGFCGAYESPWADDDRNTNRRIGKSDVARYLITEMEQVDPEAYVAMLLEVKSQEKTERRAAADTDEESNG